MSWGYHIAVLSTPLAEEMTRCRTAPGAMSFCGAVGPQRTRAYRSHSPELTRVEITQFSTGQFFRDRHENMIETGETGYK